MSFTESFRFNPAMSRMRPEALSAVGDAVFVEVGGRATEAHITREGTRVPSLKVDPGVLADVIGTVVTRPRLKVVRQSVEAGRAVERGATVDLVLAEPARLPVNIVEGVHEGLFGRRVDEVFTQFIEANPEVRRIVSTKTDPAALTAAERQTIAGVLTTGGVELEADDVPSVAAAFTGLQAANLFRG